MAADHVHVAYQDQKPWVGVVVEVHHLPWGLDDDHCQDDDHKEEGVEVAAGAGDKPTWAMASCYHESVYHQVGDYWLVETGSEEEDHCSLMKVLVHSLGSSHVAEKLGQAAGMVVEGGPSSEQEAVV
jgi:hypothetical protein